MGKTGYDHKALEKAAREKWAERNLYVTDLTDESKEPYYLLFEFPYPSGDLHIGHWFAFGVTDIFARLKRMQGKNVLFPIGFDAFGLPAENAAIKFGKDPKEWTVANMERMTEQLKSIGLSVDWSKRIASCEPKYYHWTQWLFQKFYEQGLAERRNAPVKWCPKDQTVLANEQVVNGACERCGTEVEEKNLTQWFLKITQYAERLLADLEPLPWLEEIKEAQRQWIGKSEGAKLWFTIEGSEEAIEVFTTRPDTLYGATYVVLAPEHPLVSALPATNRAEVDAYVAQTKLKTERERQENKDKTGVRLEGITAVNPVTKELIPVFAADYVLATYGTGAVMAVPAHDERDFAFAKKYDLPIRYVVAPKMIDTGNPPQDGKRVVKRYSILAVVHDPKTKKYLSLKWKEQGWTTFITGGIDADEDVVEAAKREILEETGYKNLKFIRRLGGPVWAEFFAAHKDENRIAINSPLLFELENDERDPVAQAELDQHEAHWLDLKEIAAEKMRHAEIEQILSHLDGEDGAYTGDGMLINSEAFDGRENREALWDIVTAADGEKTTNYRIRDWLVSRQRYWGCPIPVVYDPEGKVHLVPAEHLPWLLPEDVDFKPTGEAPLASSKELKERVTRIFGEGWTPEYDTLDTFVDSSWYYTRYLAADDDTQFSNFSLMKRWLPVQRYSGGSEHTTMHLLYARFFHKALYDLALVPTPEPFHERFNRAIILGPDGNKMSKSKGNVINPDDIVEKYGADAVRMYLAFIGPYNEAGHYPWSLDGVPAMRRFLERVTKLVPNLKEGSATEAERKALAKATVKVADDSERFKFNTAVSGLMVCLNELEASKSCSKEAFVEFVKLLAPFAPHLTEQLWEAVGQAGSVHEALWPAADPSLLTEDTVTVVVQVAGKKRGEVMLAPTASEEEALKAAQSIPTVAELLAQGTPKRVVYVSGKILNIVP
ncbi:MAG: leucyl-tRNA synthetase [Parcubacteria bacterium C7867-001]|nr:MAG: leucyl-tRNA synthetase [Parcubacteria bacterium C7867-001]